MTLLEIMIVIFIIGIIGSVVGYNMRGSLDQGKAFKTKEAARKLYEIVLLQEADDRLVSKDSKEPYKEISDLVKASGLIRRTKDIMEDGWDNPFEFEYNDTDYLIDLVGRKYGFKIIVDLRAIEHKNSSGKYYGSINVAFSTNAEMKYIYYQPSDSYIKKKFPNADGDFYSSLREPRPQTYFNAELSSEGMHFIFNDANAIEENLREVARDVIENINIMIKRYP
mgnify:CR=1 FL=1